jgi:hypothetical protein
MVGESTAYKHRNAIAVVKLLTTNGSEMEKNRVFMDCVDLKLT